ncbi:MAG: DUF1844 domain-containing protein [Blastocatellia bacterium]
MAEEKNTEFKVTDRRKFHHDGTPREESTETEAIATEEAKQEPLPEIAEPDNIDPDNVEPDNVEPDNVEPDNVVSFPGETARKREAQSSSQPDAAATERAQAIKAAASAAEQAYNQSKSGHVPQLPEASFLALADMLAGEAAMCLGLAQTPDGSKLPFDPETARHMIDMLGMLEQKTRGNLTAEEESVLENVLAYLRMQFVALSRDQ